MFHISSIWRFPYSDICGSKLICSSPQLFAACHVLRRLLMPRHSPYALVRLNFPITFQFSFELLEFHKQIILSVVNSLWKGLLSFAFWIVSSTFRWNCIFTQIGKTFDFFANLLVKSFVLLSVRFLLFNTLFGFQWTYFSLLSVLLVKSEELKCETPLGNFWWAQVDSNHRPRAYQARALTTWAMSPYVSFRCISFSLHPWWRWWESNPWPPACRAGALPAELHPHIYLGVSWMSLQSFKIEQQVREASAFLCTALIFRFFGFCLFPNFSLPDALHP